MRARHAVAGAAVAFLAAGIGAQAWADTGTYPPSGPPSPSVLPTSITQSPTPTAVQPSSIPFTGAEIGAMVLGGTALIGGGVVAVVAGRRRRNGAHT